jgi:5-oxoprolinase (ATP-hydrolysing) subunit A
MMLDLNCDMGELEDAAHEAALMEYITSANIACGGHAGDEATMERTARLALARGVRLGAHPGYPDRAHFGRVEVPMPGDEIEATVREQIERLERVVRRLGASLTHVKPHGALYNVAARNPEVARAIGAAVGRWNPGVVLFGLAGSQCLQIWREMGLRTAAEAFADRRYEPDGSLRPRQFADALITDSREAAAQALRFAREGIAQTLCVHGDTPGAVEILKACREALESEEPRYQPRMDTDAHR